MEELLESHPIIAGKHCMRWDLVPKNPEEVDESHVYYDAFGVEWKGVIDGIRGVIQKHPLRGLFKDSRLQIPGAAQIRP